jgi:2'-deoxynucleoside 5'-phosphate N-hydrolase
MNKVYFACSIRGGRDDQQIYEELYNIVKNYAECFGEAFTDKKLTILGMNKPSTEIYKTDIDRILWADAVIAEVTNPSLGVGYELAFAESKNIPVLCLYRESSDKRLSAMIDGCPNFRVIRYQKPTDCEHSIVDFLNNL